MNKISLVRKLRKNTDLGIKECHDLLVEHNFSLEEVYLYLMRTGKFSIVREKKYFEKAFVLTFLSEKSQAVTTFKIRFETFQKGLLEKIKNSIKPFQDSEKKIQNKLNNFVKENLIEIWDFERIEAEKGLLGVYTHIGSQLSTVVECFGEGATPELAHNLAMQYAALNPLFLSREKVSGTIKKEKLKKIKHQYRSLPNLDQRNLRVKESLENWIRENTFSSQNYIKDPDLTVQDYLNQEGAQLWLPSFRRIIMEDREVWEPSFPGQGGKNE